MVCRCLLFFSILFQFFAWQEKEGKSGRGEAGARVKGPSEKGELGEGRRGGKIKPAKMKCGLVSSLI